MSVRNMVEAMNAESVDVDGKFVELNQFKITLSWIYKIWL